MKRKKISMIIAVGVGLLFTAPTMTSFADSVNHVNNTQQKNQIVQEHKGPTKKEVHPQIEKMNIFTGKVIKNSPRRNENTSFAVTFNGGSNITYYNGQNLQPDMTQTHFHSETQYKLYQYLMNPDNRWAAENEAIGLHGGDFANDCVFFTSSALRAVGVPIPNDIGYTVYLENTLQSLGWEKETDLSTLEPGDICFAETDHAYTFMGWANKAEGIAWICDNQVGWFGTNYHPRTQQSASNVDVTPTTCYYRLPGNYTVKNVNSGTPNMPVNYDYSVGIVEVQGLHVRQEPSMEGQIIGSLNDGQRIEIVGQSTDGNWLKIMYNGQPAYTWAGYVNGGYRGISTPYNANYKVIGTGTVDFNQLGYTDLMSQGTWYSNIRGTLNNGTKVNIINQSANWYQIEYDNGTAWIPKNRLNTDLNKQSTPISPAKKTKTTNTPTKNTPTKKIIQTGVVDFNQLGYTDVMSEGTWYSNYLGTLNNNTKVNIIGENDNWYEIEFNDGTAWIPKARVNTLSQNVLGTGVIQFNQLSYTDITSEGTWYSSVLGTLNNGTKVNIIGQSDNWYEIQYNNGSVWENAWIPKNRVNSIVGKSVISTGTVDFNQLSYTDVTSEGTWYSNVLGTLNNNTKVNIIGQNDNWYEIEFNDGTAWIPKARVNTLSQNVLGTGVIQFNQLSYTDITSEGTWYSSVLGTLNNGTKVNIIGQSDNWYEIQYNNGSKWENAWVMKARVNSMVGKTVINTGTVDFNQLSYTDVMSQGTWYSTCLGTLNNGTNINIVGKIGNWYEIEYNSGTAWILKNRVSL